MAMIPIPLSAPVGGVNELTPVIALQSPQCQQLHNFNVTESGVSLRKGDSLYARVTPPGPITFSPLAIIPYADSTLFSVYRNITANSVDVYSHTTGAVVYTTPHIGTSTIPVYTLTFNKYLFVFFQTSVAGYIGFFYDGAAFGAIGYTSTLANFTPIVGNSFKNRVYLVQKDSSTYTYGGVDAISGATIPVSLASITEETTNLVAIASFTLSDQVAAVAVQSFIFANGEILFYSGSYPNSSDWTLIGRGRIGTAIGFQTVQPYQGDVLVFCESGIVSLRDVFLKGSLSAISLSINALMQKTWKGLMGGLRSLFATPSGPFYRNVIWSCYDSLQNRIIIMFPVERQSEFTTNARMFFIIFDTLRQAWSTHQSWGLASSPRGLAFYQGSTLFLSPTGTQIVIYKKEGASVFADRNPDDTAYNPIIATLVSAPISLERAFVQQMVGMDLFLKTDAQASTDYYLLKDLGVSSTLPQKISSYGTSGTLQKPNLNVGIEGSYIQYKISIATNPIPSPPTVGYELYGVTAWIENGKSPR